MDIKIAIAYHKKSMLLKHKFLIPVQAGKNFAKENLEIQGDNEGINISEKNPWYCELTVLYWLWKNTTSEYKGLMHYRRTFTCKKHQKLNQLFLNVKFLLRRLSSLWSPYNSVGVKKQYEYKESEFAQATILFCNNIESILSKGVQMIVPAPGKFYMNIRRTLAYEVGGQNIELMDSIVKDNYPNFYPYYIKAMNGLFFYNANMSVMKNDIFEDYCSLLFDILQNHEKEVVSHGYLKDVSSEKAYSRISGYLAEMITNAYIQYRMALGTQVKVMPVAFLIN